MEDIPHWKQLEIEAKKSKILKNNYPDIGKIVFYKGKYGVVIFNTDWKLEDESPEYKPGMYTDAYAIRWDTSREFDCEYGFSEVLSFVDSYELKYINLDGTLKKY